MKYTQFKPVYVVNEKFVVSEEPMTDEFLINIKSVFQFYKVKYEINNQNQVLIAQDLWEDRDLMWNYTSKANDPTWLKEHVRDYE